MIRTFAGMTTEQIQLAVALAARLSGSDAPARQSLGRATCPNCSHHGSVEHDFGTRVVRGTTYPQSWCRACRAKSSRKQARR